MADERSPRVVRSHGRRRSLARAGAAVVVLACLVLGAWTLGFRANIRTAHVAVPDAAAGPDAVVRSYVEAYNRRDFVTRAELYPFQSVPSWYERRRAIGTLEDLQITSSAPDATDGSDSASWMVVVHVRLTGLQGSDLNLQDGPAGWAYWLERSGPDRAWRIVDQGTG